MNIKEGTEVIITKEIIDFVTENHTAFYDWMGPGVQNPPAEGEVWKVISFFGLYEEGAVNQPQNEMCAVRRSDGCTIHVPVRLLQTVHDLHEFNNNNTVEKKELSPEDEAFRREAALRIFCAMQDRIEVPEIKVNYDKWGKPIGNNLLLDKAKRDAACYGAVEYADRLLAFLKGETEYKPIDK